MQSTNEEMSAVAEDAVHMAREEFGLGLDYSGPSAAAVEEMLDELREGLPRKESGELAIEEPATRQQVATLSSLYGAYLGEVIRREFGGQWQIEETHEGPMVALHVRGEVLLPPLQVYRRLVEGAGQSVWDYYQLAAYRLGRGGGGLVQLLPTPQKPS